ncbi:hypothetical protein LY76DRAFT_586586, partial [Colletotrichum caudatum]
MSAVVGRTGLVHRAKPTRIIASSLFRPSRRNGGRCTLIYRDQGLLMSYESPCLGWATTKPLHLLSTSPRTSSEDPHVSARCRMRSRGPERQWPERDHRKAADSPCREATEFMSNKPASICPTRVCCHSYSSLSSPAALAMHTSGGRSGLAI